MERPLADLPERGPGRESPQSGACEGTLADLLESLACQRLEALVLGEGLPAYGLGRARQGERPGPLGPEEDLPHPPVKQHTKRSGKRNHAALPVSVADEPARRAPGYGPGRPRP